MLVAPIIMVAWIIGQNLNSGTAIGSTFKSLHEIFVKSALEPARSALILGKAGYIGVTGAQLAPVAEITAWLNVDDVPPFVFLISLPILITLGGQIALSPIMVVVFLSTEIHELPQMPADPMLIVYALAAGWALSMTAAPNSSATLLISAITRIGPTALTWRWNGTYAVVCFLAIGLALHIVAR